MKKQRQPALPAIAAQVHQHVERGFAHPAGEFGVGEARNPPDMVLRMIHIAAVRRWVGAVRQQVDFEPVPVVPVDHPPDRLHPVPGAEMGADIADPELPLCALPQRREWPDAVADRRGPILAGGSNSRVAETGAAGGDAGDGSERDRPCLRIAALGRQPVLGHGGIGLAKLEQRFRQGAACSGGVGTRRNDTAQGRDRIAIGVLRGARTAQPVPCLERFRVGRQGATIRHRGGVILLAQVKSVGLAQGSRGVQWTRQCAAGSTPSICRATSSISAIPSTVCRMPCAA